MQLVGDAIVGEGRQALLEFQAILGESRGAPGTI